MDKLSYDAGAQQALLDVGVTTGDDEGLTKQAAYESGKHRAFGDLNFIKVAIEPGLIARILEHSKGLGKTLGERAMAGDPLTLAGGGAALGAGVGAVTDKDHLRGAARGAMIGGLGGGGASAARKLLGSHAALDEALKRRFLRKGPGMLGGLPASMEALRNKVLLGGGAAAGLGAGAGLNAILGGGSSD